MNEDEIVFGDVTYREPVRLRPPDRDERWAVIAAGKPAAGDMPIYLSHATADLIERHALSDTSVELGGILLGKECLDEETGKPFVWITHALAAKHYENTQASFTYTHDSWEEINRERDLKHPDLDIVGWYHTHPDFGIFLSGHDEFIHRNFFAQPLHVAYVVDPIRQHRGFFRWRDGVLAPVGGFLVLAERRNRVALARFVNDLESLPSSNDGGGGGLTLSPRLEAELIAMLSRPSSVSVAHDRSQTAATFGMLGALAGGLLIAVSLWIYSVAQQVREQSELLQRLEATIEKNAKTQGVAFELLLKGGNLSDPKGFTDALQKLAAERDQFEKQANDLKTSEEGLGELVASLKKNRKDLETALVKAEKKAKDYDEVVEEKKSLLAAQVDRKSDDPVAVAAELKTRYTWTWYAAAAGWISSLGLGLWLVSILGKGKLGEDGKGGKRMHA